MTERYYSDRPIDVDQESVVLEGAEAHHLLNVMRAQPGDQVVLFDGTDHEFEARVVDGKRGTARLEISARRRMSREARHRLTLAVAMPKGDRARFLVEKCTELGVSRLCPMQFQRSQHGLTERTSDKLRRYSIDAAKQCGRNRLPAIEAPRRFDGDWLEQITSPLRWVAHPAGEQPLASLERSSPSQITVVIGPEGGLTDEEVAAAIERGWQMVSLGERILRVETAALAVAALVNLS